MFPPTTLAVNISCELIFPFSKPEISAFVFWFVTKGILLAHIFIKTNWLHTVLVSACRNQHICGTSCPIFVCEEVVSVKRVKEMKNEILIEEMLRKEYNEEEEDC